MKQKSGTPWSALFVCAALLPVPAASLAADGETQDGLPDHLQGDVGGAVYANHSPIRGDSNHALLAPYGYFDYERFFSRIDTFGIKTVPLAYGYLEIAGRIKFDGYQTNTPALHGINERKNSLPIGIGSFQLTPIGGFFLNAFIDANVSHGSMYEVIYAAEWEAGKLVVYPEAGFEHYSGNYTGYYYGVSAAEAAASGYRAYGPGAATTPLLGFVLEQHVHANWYANLYVRRRWLGAAISSSPLVASNHQDTAFLSLSSRYK